VASSIGVDAIAVRTRSRPTASCRDRLASDQRVRLRAGYVRKQRHRGGQRGFGCSSRVRAAVSAGPGPEAEHHAFMNELEAVRLRQVASSTSGSPSTLPRRVLHLSANDVILGYLAHSTERITWLGIFNPYPGEHPVKVPNASPCSTTSRRPLRVRHRRGAGSHEILASSPTWRLSKTREIWRTSSASPQDVDGGVYEATRASTGRSRRAASAQALLEAHPPMWYAAATLELGDGGTAGSASWLAIGRMSEFDAVRDAYKQAIATPSRWRLRQRQS